MNTELVLAAGALADVLDAENAALLAFDLPRAAGMLAAKQSALAEFVAAQAVQAATGENAGLQSMGQRLRTLAEQNRTLLERALAVQGRVIGMIVRAAQPVTAPRYGAHGTLATNGRPVAFALCARA